MANLTPLFLNNVSGTVQAGSTAIGSSSATGVNVASGQGAAFGTISTGQYVPAVIVDTSTTPETVKEYVWVTAVATDALTVVRAAEEASRFPASTTTIAAGYVIAAVATSGALGVVRASSFPQRMKSGGYYYYSQNLVGLGTVAFNTDQVAYLPFSVANQVTLDRIGCEVTALAASGTARLGIYAATEDGQPGALILDAGNVATSAVAVVEATISQALAPGLYFLALYANAGNATYRGTSTALTEPGVGITAYRSTAVVGYFESRTTATSLPATATPSASVQLSSGPRVHVRTA